MSTPPKTFCKKSGPGFTLIEMLVVIAVIALLAGLIIPAVGGALRKAAHTKSASNLRQWGTALSSYLTDSRGRMPSRGPDQQPSWFEVSFDHPDIRKAWYNVLPPYVDEPALHAIPTDERESFLTRSSMHRDPNAEFDTSLLSSRPLFSYAFNSQLNTSREHGDDVPGIGDVRGDALPFNRYTHPTSTVVFFETRVNEDDGHPSQTGSSQFARAYGHSRHLSFRYGGRVNLLFLDGSVRRFKSDDLFNGTRVVNDDVYWSGLE